MSVLLSAQNTLQALGINMSISLFLNYYLTQYRKSTACQSCAKARVVCYLSFEKSRRKADEKQISKHMRMAANKQALDKK